MSLESNTRAAVNPGRRGRDCAGLIWGWGGGEGMGLIATFLRQVQHRYTSLWSLSTRNNRIVLILWRDQVRVTSPSLSPLPMFMCWIDARMSAYSSLEPAYKSFKVHSHKFIRRELLLERFDKYWVVLYLAGAFTLAICYLVNFCMDWKNSVMPIFTTVVTGRLCFDKRLPPSGQTPPPW